jgi:hypothetical protein
MDAAATTNARAGYFTLPFGTRALYDKCVQHAAVRAVTPELALDAWRVETVDGLPGEVDGRTVIRPAVSPTSKGSALILEPGDRLQRDELAALRGTGGPFLLHRHEAGTPFFVNAVMSGKQLTVSDAWTCRLLPLGRRHVLVSVVNAGLVTLPGGLIRSLETLAQGIGVHAGPVHVELVDTGHGARVVKLAPRLATDPLPALCRLAEQDDQATLFRRAQARDFAEPVAPPREAQGYVADYSFVFTQPGRLRGRTVDPAEGIASFRYVYHWTEPGRIVEPTADGETYGLTLFLANHSKGALLADIEQLDALNRQGIFVYD